jgi:hypothetical protein
LVLLTISQCEPLPELSALAQSHFPPKLSPTTVCFGAHTVLAVYKE